MELKVRDLRKKDQYKIDDEYLNGYARLCGIFATVVYNSLSRHADFHTQECFPSIEKIAEQHNISKPSVIKGIKELIKWNIVSVTREKDTKTKRQLPNIYLLLDKSLWVPKPTRVNHIDTESRVNNRVEPSKRQEKSRVNDVDCKDTQFKDNTVKVSEVPSQDIKIFIDLFKELNPSYERFFSNKTERECAKRLLKKYGIEKMTNTLLALPAIVSKPASN
jgi:hypothetical protein